MKKWCCIMTVCVLLFSSVFALPVNAASDFDVRSGVLVKYNGSAANVTIPDNVIAVGATAFSGNTKVQSVALNASVRTIGDRAFYGCSSLQSVTSGGSVTEVGEQAFTGTPYLEDSTAKYLMLGSVLLWYNGTSESVTIPTRCTMVASYAFARCEYLKSFTAYEGLLNIGTGAFYGCSKLSSVNLPYTVSTIGAYAFDGTPYLRDADDFAIAGDGVLLRYQGSDTEVKVPENVHRISSHAFTGSKIRSVTLSKGVYSIDAYAFADCVGLEEIALPEGLITIGDGAFRGCKSLKTCKTPLSLSYIGQYAFNGDAALENAALSGDGLTLSYYAFKGCTALKYVLLSEGVKELYDNAFDGCSALEGISVSSKTETIGASALSGCAKAVVCCEDDAAAKSALSANTVNTLMGDVDGDKDLTIVDATIIQCYIAHLNSFSGTQTALSDIDFNSEINIIDAFMIQMKVVHLL